MRNEVVEKLPIRATRDNYEDYLLVLYFGRNALVGPIDACIRRAYLDFNRTIRGIGQLPDAFDKAAVTVSASLERLRQRASETDQDSFDFWHQDTCNVLKSIYA
jgi:hypothetical protein